MPLTPDEIRQRRFDVGRRGYDKDAVDRFRTEVADTVEDLSRRLDDVGTRLGQLGIDALPDLGEELARVAAEVGVVLEEARLAATEMRRRAQEDSARWRSEAEEETAAARAAAAADAAEWRRQARAEADEVLASIAESAAQARAAAQRQIEEMRGAAWNDSAAMIEQAAADAEALVAEATQDALFIRAGAERDSLRLTGTARQDAEAELKAARSEAERVLREAEQESSRLMEEGRRDREAATEEVRRLDQERIELLVDIESLQRTFDHMDIELEARLNPQPATEGGSPPPGWEAPPAVRVVPASRLVTPGPVDADELMAEVARLRQETEAAPPSHPDAPEPTVADRDRSGSTEGEAAGERVEVGAEAVGAGEPVGAEPPPDEPPPDEPVPADAEPADLDGEAAGTAAAQAELGEPVADQRAHAAAEPGPGRASPDEVIEPAGPGAEVIALPVERVAAGAGPAPTALDDLFARLRAPGEAEPRGDTAVALAGADPDDRSPVGPSPSEPAAPMVTAEAAAEVRARLLIPVENQALRAVKRGIVDLQNRALADLHDDPARWRVDEAAVGTVFAHTVAALVDAAYAAGHVAAGELAGVEAPVPVPSTAPQPSGDPAADLAAQLGDAHRRAVAADSAARDTAAAVSRVFRAWRTDEGERRLHAIAWSAFTHGVLGGLAVLGVARVTTVAEGRGCVDCAARAPVAWDPAGPPPDGWEMPPAHAGCVVSIVPSRVPR